MSLDSVKTLADNIRIEVGKAIIGQSDTVDLMLVALFSGGHILLEGVPGTAKTFLAQVFSHVMKMDFGRIQFTPDLMPGDLLGTNLFSFQTNEFNLVKGPIFCDLLLADEINRTPPKTQAALLEAMQERQVTIDGEAFPLGSRFMVIATLCPKHSLTALFLSMCWITRRAKKRLKLSVVMALAQALLRLKIWALSPSSRARTSKPPSPLSARFA